MSAKVPLVNRTVAAAGVIAVMLMTAIMLATADAYLWEYPTWAWGLISAAALALCANALARPSQALSPLAVVVSILIGIALAWPVTVGGDGWRPAWLVVGIAMPLLGCWLLKAFSLAFRKA
jgi:hypothetical protein